MGSLNFPSSRECCSWSDYLRGTECTRPGPTTHVQEVNRECHLQPIVHPDHNSYPPFTCQLNLYDRRLVLLELPNAECVSTLNMPHATLRLKYTANIMTPTHQIRSGAYSGSSVRDFLCRGTCLIASTAALVIHPTAKIQLTQIIYCGRRPSAGMEIMEVISLAC